MGKLLINYTPFEVRVGLIENNQLVEFYVERASEKGLVGNIYKAKVVRVVPGINSAFLDLGLSRTAFLFGEDIMPSTEVEWDKEGMVFTNLHEVLKEGQEILVQVIKEPIGNKGARVSTNLTLPGHYLVYLPFVNHIGISRKIKNEEERKRLKNLLEKLRPPNTGWIIRTAAVEAEEEDLKIEIDFLLCLWKEIKEKTEKVKAPALIYEELNIALRAIRDLFNKEISAIIVDDREIYEEIKNFLDRFFPHLVPYVELFESNEDIFTAHGIQIDIKKILSKKVWLKSGGFIIIEPCEAFTAVDVNTGRYIGSKELEDTVFKINLEAAEEIAYQLRLRNIGGLIIIDFIDMENPEHQERILQTLKEALKKDKAKHSFLPITSFGILQMTRERKRESLYQIFYETCPYCQGEGKIKSKRSIYYEILRKLIKMGPQVKNKKIEIEINPNLSEIMGEEIYYLESIEKKYGFTVMLKPNKEIHLTEYKFHILSE